MLCVHASGASNGGGLTVGWRCYRCGDTYNGDRPRWCSRCGGVGTTVLVGVRASAAVDAVPEVTDAAQLVALAGEPDMVAAYPSLRCGRGALVVLWGPPGGGKSTMAARWLDGLRGPVLYAALEEGLGPTLAGRLSRLGITRRDFGVIGRASVDDLCAEIRRRRAVGLVVDSVQRALFEPAELRHVLATHPTLRVLIAVCQVNAKGVPEGKKALLHEADVSLRVGGLRSVLEKSRYQEVCGGSTDLPVLSDPGEVGDTVRQAQPAVRHLRSVSGEAFFPRDSIAGGTDALVASGSGGGATDHDGPGGVDAPPGNADDGRCSPGARHGTH